MVGWRNTGSMIGGIRIGIARISVGKTECLGGAYHREKNKTENSSWIEMVMMLLRYDNMIVGHE